MKRLLFLLFLMPLLTLGQKRGDTKIVVTVSDTTNIHQRVKTALAKCDFVVRSDESKDTIKTHIQPVPGVIGQCRVTAIVNDNKIILSGIYGLKAVNMWGYTADPNSFKRIIYYKASKTWPILAKVAKKIGGTLEYSK